MVHQEPHPMSTLSLILRDNRIRIPTVTLVALAFTYASTVPYQSIIGINELGLTNGTYSALVFFSAIVNVTTSLTLGIWSDRLKERRPLVLALSVAGMLGFGSIAIIFAFGTSVTDYSGTAFVGAAAGLASIGALLYLESSRRQVRQPA
ncbi:MFS transporter [Rhizobium croatiense]|uniref:MFS transporter n=1 Tax=Rhizobium croatiense TaxID=2867516 RepID=UPI0024848434|nr:MFS transporter [Rhizobium croatiense]